MLAGSRFAFAAIIARRLSVEVFGQVAYGQWLGDVAFLVCSLGATGFIGRYVAEYRDDPGLLTAYVRHWRPFAHALPWVAAAVAPIAAKMSGMSLAPGDQALIALLTLAGGQWAMRTAVLSGLQRFDLVFFATAAASAILIVGALILPAGLQSPGYVFGIMSLAAGAAAVVGYRATHRIGGGVPALVGPTQWRAAHRYAINMWVAALLWSFVWSRGELPVVRAYLGDDGVARYAAVLTLFGGAMQGVMLVTSGIAPQLTGLWGQGLRLHAVALARKVMDMQLLACGVGAVLLVLFSREFMELAFGVSYRGGAGQLATISLGLVAMAVSSQNHLLQIATDGRFTRNTTLVGLIVLLGSAVLLVGGAGLFGAALARVGTMLLMAGVTLVSARRRWGVSAYSPGNVVGVVLLVASCVAARAWTSDTTWPFRACLATLAVTLLFGKSVV